MTSSSNLPAPRVDPETGEVTPWTDRQVEYAGVLSSLPIVADSDDMALAIMRRVAAAADIEEATTDVETVALKDLVGRRITVHSVILAPSGKRSGCGWYALIKATIEPRADGKADPFADDPEQVVNTGALKALAVLNVAVRDQLLPWEARVTGTKSNTDSSNEVVSLVPADRF